MTLVASINDAMISQAICFRQDHDSEALTRAAVDVASI
jgi:hypothetical protein